MPLHDWADRPGWEGVHHLWIAEILRWVKPRLPLGYRATSARHRRWPSDQPAGNRMSVFTKPMAP